MTLIDISILYAFIGQLMARFEPGLGVTMAILGCINTYIYR